MFNKRNAAIGFIFVTLLIDVTGFGIIIPVVPKLIMDLTGKDMSHAARWGTADVCLCAYAVSFAPVLGGLSGSLTAAGRCFWYPCFGFGLDYLLTAFAPSIGWLFLGRALAGIMGSSFRNRFCVHS
jgi:DHA1 family tetracycline resistance protein-like MFS transporter